MDNYENAYIINDEILTFQIQTDLNNTLNQNIIYKYTNFSTAIDHIITANSLKFTNPKEFNDPFDCHEGLINIPAISNEQFQVVLEESQIIKNRFNKKFLDKNRTELLRRVNNKQNIQSSWKKEFDYYKVSCFSKTNDNPLMWAHYADKHKGIVIGFHFPLINENFAIYPVKYFDKMAAIDNKLSVEKVLYYWLTTKSHHWAYEKEIRAISKNGKDIIPFKKEWLTEITFGSRVEENEIKKSISSIRNKLRYKNILIKKMIIDPETFSLKEEIIADIQNFKNKINTAYYK